MSNILLSSKPFTYDDLDLQVPTVRLLRILPSSTADDIQCELSHVTLQAGAAERAPYAALSYTWGIDQPNHHIKINGRDFAIRANLMVFLQHFIASDFAKEQRFYHIWIDAICIDQTNIVERNRQVQLMKKIFQLARPVLIWPGVPDQASSLVGEVAIKMQEASAYEKESMTEFEEQVLHGASSSEDNAVKLGEAVSQLAHRSYWNRAWVVQEVLLTAYPVLMLDRTLISWRAWSALVENVSEPNAKSPGLRMHLLKGNFSRDSRSRQLESLLRLLQVTETPLQCHDRRDRIYALLGLALKGESFEVDYAISAEDLLYRVLRFFPANDFPTFVQTLSKLLYQTDYIPERAAPTHNILRAEVHRLNGSFSTLFLPSQQPITEICVCTCDLCHGRASETLISTLVEEAKEYDVARLPSLNTSFRILAKKNKDPTPEERDATTANVPQYWSRIYGMEILNFRKLSYPVSDRHYLKELVGKRLIIHQFPPTVLIEEMQIILPKQGFIRANAAFMNHAMFNWPEMSYVDGPMGHHTESFQRVWPRPDGWVPAPKQAVPTTVSSSSAPTLEEMAMHNSRVAKARRSAEETIARKKKRSKIGFFWLAVMAIAILAMMVFRVEH